MDENARETRHHAIYDSELTKNVTRDYINHRLTTKGYVWPGCPELPAPTNINLLMRTLGDELENRYREVFDEMCDELHVTLSSAYPTFVGVTNELFAEGFQWGRFVALFAFGGALAVQCVYTEMPHLVDSIVEWVSTYVDEKLAEAMLENGGWEGFVKYFDSDEHPERRREIVWPSLKNFFCGVAAGAIGVLTIGAILTSRS